MSALPLVYYEAYVRHLIVRKFGYSRIDHTPALGRLPTAPQWVCAAAGTVLIAYVQELEK